MARKKRTLSDDDHQLWRQVAASVDPLHPKKKQTGATAHFSGSSGRVKPSKTGQSAKAVVPIQAFQIGSKAKTALPAPHATPHTAVGNSASMVSPNMDRRNFQRLLRGQIEIDATLDLHGMTAELARQRLVLYLQQAHARGARLILVITGKGTKTHIDEFNRPRSGILRAALPDWLRGGALSGLVLQVTQAHPKHGGKGAFYVYLRRRR